jgi:hypothetical protein
MTSGNGARLLPSSSYCFRPPSQAFRTMHSRSLHLGFHPVACTSLELSATSDGGSLTSNITCPACDSYSHPCLTFCHS